MSTYVTVCGWRTGGGGRWRFSPFTPSGLKSGLECREGSRRRKVKKMKKLLVFSLCLVLLTIYTGRNLLTRTDACLYRTLIKRNICLIQSDCFSVHLVTQMRKMWDNQGIFLCVDFNLSFVVWLYFDAKFLRDVSYLPLHSCIHLPTLQILHLLAQLIFCRL